LGQPAVLKNLGKPVGAQPWKLPSAGINDGFGLGAFGSPTPVNAYPAPRVQSSNDESSSTDASTEDKSSDDESSEGGEGAGLTVNKADEGPKVNSAAPEVEQTAWVEAPPGFYDEDETKASDVKAEVKSLEEKVEEMK